MAVAPDGLPNLKLRLVDVATALLTQPGELKLPTMRAIATSAGVAPGAAYRHFQSQNDLFLAVVANLFSQLEAELQKALTQAQDQFAAVQAMSHAYVNWGIQNQGGYQLLFETTDTAEFLVQGERPGKHLIDVLAHLFSAPNQPMPPHLKQATRLWVSLHGLVSLRTHKTGMTWTTTLAEDVDHLVNVYFTNSDN